MKVLKKKALAVAVTLAVPGLLAAGAARAEDGDIGFTGFGTIGVTHSNSKEADFAASLYAPNGVGATKSTALSPDTRAGIQASARIGGGLSGVLQIVSDRRYDNTYQPKVEWANLKYDVTKDTYVRLGRVVSPVFMISEYRNVGYAQTAARAPWDVYSLNPITHIDGGNVASRFDIGDGVLSANVSGGKVNDTLSGAKVAGSSGILNLAYETGASTFSFGYGKFKLDMELNGPSSVPFAMYQSLIPVAGPSVGYPQANVRATGLHGHMIDFGYTYDSGPWIVQAEYVERRAETPLIQDMDAWSVQAGYRVGKFTPYASYSKVKSKHRALPYAPAQVPASLSGAYAACNAGMLPPATCAVVVPSYMQAAGVVSLFNGIDTNIDAQRPEESTVSFGVRYDFYKNLALKAQYDRISKPAASVGQFVIPAAGWPASWLDNSKTVTVFTVNLDFVF